jgi:hypothetical protein
MSTLAENLQRGYLDPAVEKNESDVASLADLLMQSLLSQG